jgi:DNA-binding CsgD family transcriptional regulator
VLPSTQVLTKLIGSGYDAAAEPTLWKPFLEQLAKTSRADASGLVMHDDRRETHDIASSWNVDPEMLRLYRQHYGPLDIWTTRGKSNPVGWVGTSEELCPLNDLRRTEVYNDLMVPSDIEYGMFGILQRDGARWAALSLYRRASSRDFRVSDLDTLRFLVPHMQSAFKLHFQFSELKGRSEGIEAALNMLTTSVIFLGAKGEVLLMNQKAEELLGRNDGLFLARGRLSAAVRAESARLQALTHGATQTGIGRGLSAGGTILISRGKGRSLAVTVAPIRTFNNSSLSQRPAAVLFISDPDRNLDLPIDLLQRCYGLTSAEARLTMILLEGHSLKEAANSSGVTYNTAKSQLKIIFLKTNVQRQGQLIRLLLNTTGMTHRDGRRAEELS